MFLAARAAESSRVRWHGRKASFRLPLLYRMSRPRILSIDSCSVQPKTTRHNFQRLALKARLCVEQIEERPALKRRVMRLCMRSCSVPVVCLYSFHFKSQGNHISQMSLILADILESYAGDFCISGDCFCVI